jgi:hypothetical protein
VGRGLEGLRGAVVVEDGGLEKGGGDAVEVEVEVEGGCTFALPRDAADDREDFVFEVVVGGGGAAFDFDFAVDIDVEVEVLSLAFKAANDVVVNARSCADDNE